MRLHQDNRRFSFSSGFVTLRTGEFIRKRREYLKRVGWMLIIFEADFARAVHCRTLKFTIGGHVIHNLELVWEPWWKFYMLLLCIVVQRLDLPNCFLDGELLISYGVNLVDFLGISLRIGFGRVLLMWNCIMAYPSDIILHGGWASKRFRILF